jgi:hypothetical protein
MNLLLYISFMIDYFMSRVSSGCFKSSDPNCSYCVTRNDSGGHTVSRYTESTPSFDRSNSSPSACHYADPTHSHVNGNSHIVTTTPIVLTKPPDIQQINQMIIKSTQDKSADVQTLRLMSDKLGAILQDGRKIASIAKKINKNDLCADVFNNGMMKAATHPFVGAVISSIQHTRTYNECVDDIKSPVKCTVATTIGVTVDIGLKLAGSAITASGVALSAVAPLAGAVVAGSGVYVITESGGVADNITNGVIETIR